MIYVQEEARHFLNLYHTQGSLDQPEYGDQGMVATTDEDVASVNDHHSRGAGHRRVHLVHAFFPEVGQRNFKSKQGKSLFLFVLISTIRAQ